MATLTKVLTLTVTPEQFLEHCSDLELKELDLRIQTPRYANRINDKKEIGLTKTPFDMNTETTMKPTPKAIIFKALGGYQNKDAKRLSETITQALLAFMTTHEQEIVVCKGNQKSIQFLGKNE